MPAKEIPVEFPGLTFKGLVLNPNQLNSPDNSAYLASNVEKASNGQLTIRKGVRNAFRQARTYRHQVLFPATYTYHDTTTGGTQEELVALAMNMNDSFVQQNVYLYRINERTVTITYVGAGTGRLQIYPELAGGNTYKTQWRVILTANGSQVFNQAFSVAEDSSIGALATIGSLVTSIHALAAFNCSPTSLAADASESAIDVVGPYIDHTFASSGTYDLTYYGLTAIGQMQNAPRVFTDANFTIPSFQSFNNVLDIAYGRRLYKYDGNRVYEQGLEPIAISSIADAAAGATFPIGTTYIYKILLSRVDNRGNIVEGAASDDTLAVATHTMAATKNMDVTIPLMVPSLVSGYAGAKVNGLQAAVTTVTVDAGHTLLAGDTIYVYDTATSAYVTRVLTSVGATTITFAGAISVADNSNISNNVRIQIWRTKASGTDFYFVDEIPATDGVGGTQVYTDSKADSLLTELYEEQIRAFDQPPACSFVGQHQGLRVVAGDPSNPNTISWSLPDNPEAFPLASNNSNINGGGLGGLTGFGTVDDDCLAVFKEQGHVQLIGSLDDLTVEIKDKTNTGIGCTSFNTITNVGEENSLVGLSAKGPFAFAGRSASLIVSQNIKPLFDEAAPPQVNGTAYPSNLSTGMLNGSGMSTSIPRSLKRAVAINDALRNKYHLLIPAEIGTPAAAKVPHFPSCKYLVFDYEPGNMFWTERTFYNRYRELVTGYWYQNVIPNSGFCLYKNKLWWGSHTVRNPSSTTVMDIRASLGYFKENNDIYDYSDDSWPIYLDLHYNPIVRTPGSPSHFFKALWAIIHRFLPFSATDPADVITVTDFGEAFSLNVRIVKDFKQYTGNTPITNASRTFNPDNAMTSMRIKCVNSKARAIQIQINNEDAACDGFEQPAFDNIEFIYCTPYDPKTKEPTSRG